MFARARPLMALAVVLILLLGLAGIHETQARPATAAAPAEEGVRLTQIATCDQLQDGQPLDVAVIFSTAAGRVLCYNRFENIPARTEIIHNWYHRDALSSRVRLMLNPPTWSTYSHIQLRPQDLGPWRVEVTDARGRLLGLVRFSVTE